MFPWLGLKMGILTPTSAKPCSPTDLPSDNNSPFCCIPARSCRSGIGSRFARAKAASARAKREPIPDLQLRAGMQQNGELLSDGRSVGLQGFADVGVRIPIFNRNQGHIATARDDVERER